LINVTNVSLEKQAAAAAADADASHPGDGETAK